MSDLDLEKQESEITETVSPHQGNKQLELDVLKQQADELNITYSGRIGSVALRDKIQVELARVAEEQNKSAPTALETRELTPDEARKAKIINKRNEANRLVRVIVTPVQPEKRNSEGEIFAVSNDIVSLKKFVPFGTENGWHIPMGLYMTIKEKKYQTFRETTVDGKKVKRGSLVPAYNVHVLDSLTPKELAELAKAQRARNTMNKE